MIYLIVKELRNRDTEYFWCSINFILAEMLICFSEKIIKYPE